MVDKAKKIQRVEEFKDAFAGATTVVVSSFSGLTIPETDQLRKIARKNKTKVVVAKNTLAQVAVKGTKHEGISPLFKTQTIITYSDDPIGPARTIADFAKTNEKLSVAGGSFDGKVLDVAGVNELASVPSLEESRAAIVWLLKASASELVRVMKSHGESSGAPAASADNAAEAAPAPAEAAPAPAENATTN